MLHDVSWVATTADCWTAHHRSYLGMTVHWIDPTSRKRCNAVLACSRITGRHTFSVLADAMVDIHEKFGIQNKVIRTITDNGSNFVKAFVQFGTESDLLDFVPEEDAVSSDEFSIDEMSSTEESLEYVPVDETLNDGQCEKNLLPPHMRCAAHTLNLVASVDSNEALKSSVFKLAYRRTMAKGQALWNQQNRSSVSADVIVGELKRRLLTPNSTRWNSTYDSMVVLYDLLESNRGGVRRVTAQLKLQAFTDEDIAFMKEYIQVMAIVAKALDKVQGENQAYLGSFLPTIAAEIVKQRTCISAML